MGDQDIVFSSTTDSPEQIREGLGLPPAEPVETETETPVETAAVEETPPVAEVKPEAAKPTAQPVAVAATPAKAKLTPRQKELDRTAAAARRDSESKNAILEAEIKALRERLESTLAPPTTADGKPIPADAGITASFDRERAKLGAAPKQEDFENYGDFETKRDDRIRALARLDAREELAQESHARRTAAATADASRHWNETLSNYTARIAEVRTKYKDYDAIATAADKSDLRAADPVKFAVLAATDAVGELQYHLMKHPAVLDKLNRLAPARAAVEIGRLAATLSTGAPRPAAPRPKPISHAPEPTGTELGHLSSAVTDDLESAPDQRTYNAMRQKQRAARGLGR